MVQRIEQIEGEQGRDTIPALLLIRKEQAVEAPDHNSHFEQMLNHARSARKHLLILVAQRKGSIVEDPAYRAVTLAINEQSHNLTLARARLGQFVWEERPAWVKKMRADGMLRKLTDQEISTWRTVVVNAGDQRQKATTPKKVAYFEDLLASANEKLGQAYAMLGLTISNLSDEYVALWIIEEEARCQR